MTAESSSGLREQLRIHATRLFALRGFAGTSMRDLVESCQCTKAACYYYFSSKEALYREVVEHHSGRIQELLQAVLGHAGSIRQRLHAGLDPMVDYAIAEPLAMQLMQRIELSPEDTAPVLEHRISREMHLQVIAQLVSGGIKSGEFRAGMNALDAATVLTGTIAFQFDNSIVSGVWDRARMHTTIDLVLDGIATHD